MIKLKDIGNFETLPEIAMSIYNRDLPALQAAYASGWNLEADMELGKYTSLSPLNLALIAERFEIVKWLVEQGVNLNAPDNPAFLVAVRYCKADIVRYITENGGKLDGHNKVGSNAYSEAYYGNKNNIPLIQELGLEISRYGGRVLRQAVSDYNIKLAAYLLDQGADINYSEADMVYPYQATPLTVAARTGNMKMVQFLVERGADVTKAEKDGERPYTIAVSHHYTEMADYLKSLEPKQFHSLASKQYELQKFKLSDELTRFLTGDELRLELPPNDYDIRYIEFFALTDTIEMKAGRKKLLRLSAGIDNYSHLYLVWNPQKKGLIGCYDTEHKEYADLCSFSEFMLQPAEHLIRFMEGEY